MTKVLLGGLLAFSLMCSAGVVQSETSAAMEFHLTSVSDHARYGLLIALPDEVACGAVQFVVKGQGNVVGRSLALRPGEVQVVRIGHYPAGVHRLTITASGCAVRPAAVRRVRLGKPSPDHGWRAALVQAAFAP